MELYTMNDIKDQVVGKVGTAKRDDMERELTNFRIGLQIRNARKAKNMTQKQLAEKIGKERSFISKIETAGANLTLNTLYDIVERGLGMTFNIDISDKHATTTT